MTNNKGPEDFNRLPTSNNYRPKWYKLKWRKIVPLNSDDINKVEHNLKYGRKFVRRTNIDKQVYVSTVFLSLDHSSTVNSKPSLFETAIITTVKGDREFDITGRCATWKEALKMHWAAVSTAKVIKV